MPSPFPGMDPYLEDDGLWPVFHHQLVMCLYQILLPGLVDRYRARVGQRHYLTEQALFTSVVREEHHEDYIEVRQRTDGRRREGGRGRELSCDRAGPFWWPDHGTDEPPGV